MRTRRSRGTVSDTSTRTAQDALLAALRRIFRPLLRICLRAGVSMAQIRAVLDHVAVREAERYLVESRKKSTYSNISMITGIERRQVANLLGIDVEEGPPPTVSALHRAVRVLNGWHEDPTWTTRLGTPATLDVRGEGPSFESLANRYAGGISPAAILERLIETNTVEVVARHADGRPARVRPLQATIAPDVSATRVFDEFGTVYGEALEMFDGNLRSPKEYERMRPYSVTATVLAPKLRFIRRQLKERGESVQVSLDEALAQHDLSTQEVAELSESDPDLLYAIRVTLFSTIRPAVARQPVVRSAWRRDAEKPVDEDGATAAARAAARRVRPAGKAKK